LLHRGALVRIAAVLVDLHAGGRVRALVTTIADSVAVRVGLAAPLVHRASRRRVGTVIDAIEDSVAVVVHGGPAIARRVGIDVAGLLRGRPGPQRGRHCADEKGNTHDQIASHDRPPSLPDGLERPFHLARVTYT